MYVDSNISEKLTILLDISISVSANLQIFHFFFLQILHRSVILDEHNLILCIYVEIQKHTATQI